MQKIYFQSLGTELAGDLLIPEIKNPPVLLILHGAGHSHKEKFLRIQEAVAAKGFASLAFDFTGVGESGGEFADGSLAVRLQNAKDALQELKKYTGGSNISVLGSSMGGFLAPLIAASDPIIKNVILLAAAAYSPDAEDKKLNSEFTQIIRKPNSWENSRSFAVLETFAGRVLVLYGENDTAIPYEIKNRYQKITHNKGEWYTIADAGHNLITAESPKEQKAIDTVISRVSHFLTNY